MAAQPITLTRMAMLDADKTREQLLAELKALRSSERLHRAVAECSPDWDYLISPDGTLAFVSPAVERITGYSPTAFYADPDLLRQMVHPEDRDVFAAHLAALGSAEAEACDGLDFRIITKDGRTCWIAHHCRQALFPDGTSAGRRSSNRDITARRRMDERAYLAEQQLRAILEASIEGMVLMDAQGRVLAANRATLERLNTDERALVSTPFYDFFPAEVARHRREMVQRVVETGRPARFEDQRAGRTILNSIYPVQHSDHSVAQVAMFGMDITEERLAKQEAERNRLELAQANLMLQLVIDTIPFRIFWKDHESRYLGCNRRFSEDAGRSSPAELIGETDFNLAWKSQAEAYRADDLAVMTLNRSKINYEEEQTTATGAQGWLLTTKVPLIDVDGRVIGVFGMYDDITARKQLETRLRDSEERYRCQFHSSHAMQLIIEPETGHIVDANPAACRYYGWEPEVFRTKSIADVNVLPREQIFEEMARAKAEQRNYFQFLHRRADGDVRPVEVYSGPIWIQERQLLHSIVHDISDRKKAEADRERLILELRAALSRIKTLSGLLPICSSCKRIRNDQGYWELLECYIRDHSEAEFTHGICPGCMNKLYPEFNEND